MTHRGTVRNGVVVLDRPGALPDGAEVSIRAVKVRGTRSGAKPRPRTLYERYKRFVGVVKDLPADMSVNLDHYLYGAPKEK